jgi:hypothetical protein
MRKYLLSVMQPDGPPPGPEVMGPITRNLQQFHDELHAAGAWVFANGLHPAESATVVRVDGDDVVVTDGPYLEGKEHVGGICIDAALEWGRKAARAITLPIEVRSFADEGDDEIHG